MNEMPTFRGDTRQPDSGAAVALQRMVMRCNEPGCEREATEHRPGFGEHWWKCKEHDEQAMNAVRSMRWLCA